MLELPCGRRVVLSIDDDEHQLTVRSAVLQLWGYDVVNATNGRAALLILGHMAVDLVVLDYGMPDMDGMAVATAIRKRWSRLPIIGVSGLQSFEVPQQFLNLINAFVHKGSPPAELMFLLHKFTNEQQPVAA